MSLASFNKLLVSLSLFACASVFAAPLVVNVAGIQSQGEIGESGNTVLTYDVGANSVITSVAYSFNLTAFSPSWLSEIGLAFTDSDGFDGVVFNPGFGDSIPGTATYAGFADLVDLDLDFAVGADVISQYCIAGIADSTLARDPSNIDNQRRGEHGRASEQRQANKQFVEGSK